MKSVLVGNNETSIYEAPDSKSIKEAQKKVNDKESLADILLNESNFKTIKYHCVIDKYIELTNQTSDKVKNVLLKLSENRNAVTHFGIKILDYDEIVLTFINTFDVIYNYLYDSLILVDEIEEYLALDDLVIQTVHEGNKWFVDEDGFYIGFSDYLDELLTDYNDYFFTLRANNPKTNILKFEKLLSETLKNKSFDFILKKYNAGISLKDTDIEDHNLFFEIDMPNTTIEVLSKYSMYYNATIFENDAGDILFIVLHDENSIYLYKEDVYYPYSTEPENDKQWLVDESNGLCEKYNLSMRNLIKVFEEIFKRYKL